MHPGESSKRSVPPALGSGGCIDALPDGVLGHILGFLPAPEAVRTCVLARRWRHLWRTATRLRVGNCSEYDGTSVKEQREFVDHLLLLRGSSPLDICEFGIGELHSGDESRVNLWFRHVVMCRARVLRLHVFGHMFLELDDLPLVSQHLTKLYLCSVRVQNSFLNFSSCPALEHLELVDCDLNYVDKIASKSLKHLSLTDCDFDQVDQFRCIRISTPSLVSLHLDSFDGTPIFDSMPSLVKAFVRITEGCWDFCYKPDDLDCTCLLCDGFDSRGSSVLLKGLSQVQSLVLISAPNQIIFKSDLRWCPMFSNLKTLLLNGYWCTPDDFSALACILEHSPVLAKLTLELFSEGPKYKVEMKGRCNLMERSAKISENLNIVEVKCQVVDERVLEVLKFLCTFNISFTF
ncbi:putative F-box/LRR-repeat protein At3g44810 [Miscanthus floridulus]|uniref:putative F-box/LRR-repeat protein At3g44810 n=1 Tax=Miscanthus floridulus TaxID=154761 RepID=UPI0034582253